jgi:hypothetical protein
MIGGNKCRYLPNLRKSIKVLYILLIGAKWRYLPNPRVSRYCSNPLIGGKKWRYLPNPRVSRYCTNPLIGANKWRNLPNFILVPKLLLVRRVGSLLNFSIAESNQAL